MPTLRGLALPAPEHHQEFEALCLDLLRAMKQPRGEPNLYGRSGQAQHGVDFVLEMDDGLHAYQCKRVEALTAAEFDDEVRKLGGLPLTIMTYTVLTTAENDARLQDHVLEVSTSRRARGEPSVHVVFWTTVRDWLDDHRAVLASHYREWLGLQGKALASTLYGVPDGTQHFAGRDRELARIGVELSQQDVAVSAAIEGLPGVGKSELAVQLARRLSRAGAFPGGIFWLDAETGDLTASWDRVGGLMGIPAGPSRADLAVSAVTGKESPVLLILDNLVKWNPEPSPLPTGTHIHRLATTRQRDFGGTRFKHHALDLLAPSVARVLFDSIVGRLVSGSEALLDYLDGHALAVELAASWLRDPEADASDYLMRLQAGHDPAADVRDRVRYERTVHQALSMLWERLDQEDRLAWATGAALGPGPISTDLLDACGIDLARRKGLRGWFLLRAEGEQRWGLHRLVRDFARGAPDQKRACAVAAFNGVLACAREIDLINGYAPYLLNESHYEQMILTGPIAEDELGLLWLRLASLVATGRQSAGRHVAACDLFRQAIATARRTLGDDGPPIGGLLLNLGNAQMHLGDPKGAKATIEAALSLEVAQWGPTTIRAATCHSNLAMVLVDLGEAKEAVTHMEMALACAGAEPGHPDLSTWQSNLAFALTLADVSRHHEARRLINTALAADLARYGAADPRVAFRRVNLAVILEKQGDIPGAKEQAEQARSAALLLPQGSSARTRILRAVGTPDS